MTTTALTYTGVNLVSTSMANPANVKTLNGIGASHTYGGQAVDTWTSTTFPFSIPANAIVASITLVLTLKEAGSGYGQLNNIDIIAPSGTLAGLDASNFVFGIDNIYHTYTQTYNVSTIKASDVNSNSTAFGVNMYFYNPTDSSATTPNLDAVAMQVAYSLPGGFRSRNRSFSRGR